MQCSRCLPILQAVALFTRAWIEIRQVNNEKYIIKSPSLRGRGLKSGYELTQKMIEKSRPLYEGVD